MDLRFTPEQEAFRADVRQFIQANLDPRWPGDGDGMWDDRDDATWAMAREFLTRLGARGWLALSWPQEYGGGGRSIVEQSILLEELALAGTPAIDMAITFVGPSIMLHGSPEAKKRFLPSIATGEVTFAEGLSEPNAGSDLASLTTRAVRDGDWYVINGEKTWTSCAHRADYIWLAARTDPSAPRHRGISCLLVDTRSPGITIRPIVNILGVHSFNQVYFQNVKVPLDCLIGQENEGWSQIMTTLNYERAIFGAGVGTAAAQQRHLLDLIRYVKANPPATATRRELVRHKLADLAVAIEVSRALAYRVVAMQAQGKVPDAEVSTVKIFNSELAQRVSATALAIMGPYGGLSPGSPHAYLSGRPLQHFYTALSYSIGAGTSEIQRNIVAQRGLGLPRS